MDWLTMTFNGDWYTWKWALCLGVGPLLFAFRKDAVETAFATGLSMCAWWHFVGYELDPTSGNLDRIMSVRNSVLLAACMLSASWALYAWARVSPHRRYSLGALSSALFGWNILLTCAALIFGWDQKGLDSVTSINATLLALQFWHWARHPRLSFAPTFLLIFFLILKLQSTVGIASLFTGMFIRLVVTRPMLLALVAPILGGITWWVEGSRLLMENGRLKAWGLVVGWLSGMRPYGQGEFGVLPYRPADGSWLMGNGPGSFWAIFPNFQLDIGWVPDGYFVFLHNDILQGIFEFGLVGLIPWVIVFGLVVHRCLKYSKTHYLSFVGAYIPAALGYYPTHLALEAFLLIIFLSETFSWTKSAESLSWPSSMDILTRYLSRIRSTSSSCGPGRCSDGSLKIELPVQGW